MEKLTFEILKKVQLQSNELKRIKGGNDVAYDLDRIVEITGVAG